LAPTSEQCSEQAEQAAPGLGDLGGLLGGLQNPGPSTGKSPTSTDQQSGGGLFGLLGALLGGGRQ